MSAESKKISDTFVDQLDSFDDRLDASVDDVELLADIQKGIGSLLASSGSDEGEIRRVLLERYQTGSLRKETFELVNSSWGAMTSSEQLRSFQTMLFRLPQPTSVCRWARCCAIVFC
jgi:hypothetical protein